MNEFKIPEPPLGMVFNPDKKTVDLILNSLANRSNGFCPCVVKHLHTNEDYKCVCKNARESLECLCKLFVKA